MPSYLAACIPDVSWIRVLHTDVIDLVARVCTSFSCLQEIRATLHSSNHGEQNPKNLWTFLQSSSALEHVDLKISGCTFTTGDGKVVEIGYDFGIQFPSFAQLSSAACT